VANSESPGTLPYLSSMASAHVRCILLDANAASAHATVCREAASLRSSRPPVCDGERVAEMHGVLKRAPHEASNSAPRQ